MIHKNCKCQKVILSKEQIRYLRKIGLGKSAVELYNMLLVVGPLTAQDAATHTHDFPSAHYRLFYELENKELIRRLEGKPVSFGALDMKTGLRASFIDTKQELSELISPDKPGFDQNTAKVLIGRKSLYDTYCRYADIAKTQIYIYSIGIAYSKKLYNTQLSAIGRGVKIYHVVQEVKPANYHVIHRWKKIGVNLKFQNQSRGYHLVVIDSSYAIVTFSSVDDTEDRVSMLSENQSIIPIFLAQFEEIWSSAKNLSVE